MHYYTDGAYSSATKIGGWGVIIYNKNMEETKRISDCMKNTTSNRMELMAFLVALEEAKGRRDKDAHIYTDSAYIYNCFKEKWYEYWITNGWRNVRRQLIKNRDLWEAILNLVFSMKINLHKVKAHETNQYNNAVDELAVAARSIK